MTSGGWLNAVERIGNKVPNPTIMFVYLIAFIAILSAVLSWFHVSVTDEIMTQVPKAQLQQMNEALGGTLVPFNTQTQTITELPEYTVSEVVVPVRSLLTADGLQEFFSGFVDNFA